MVAGSLVGLAGADRDRLVRLCLHDDGDGDPAALLCVEMYADRAEDLPPRLERLEQIALAQDGVDWDHGSVADDVVAFFFLSCDVGALVLDLRGHWTQIFEEIAKLRGDRETEQHERDREHAGVVGKGGGGTRFVDRRRRLR